MNQNFAQTQRLTWCDGCGNYGIFNSLRTALHELELDEKKVFLCFDIGCNGNGNDKLSGYRAHTLHGRVLPFATGAKLANPELIVIAMAGDGATYAEGMNHFVHSIRNEFPLTFIVHDNGNYGLTTGQCSPTSPQDNPYNSNPHGNLGKVLNPLDLALTLGATFVAQGFSGEMKSLKELIKLAIKHQNSGGFAYLNILQTCPTYNKFETNDEYIDEIVNYTSEKYKYTSNLLENDVTITNDKDHARKLISDTPHKFCGVLYEEINFKGFMEHAKFDLILENRENDSVSLDARLRSYR